jgi:hypothetical protein
MRILRRFRARAWLPEGVNATKLRKSISIAVFTSAFFLSHCSAYGQETWGTSGASSWGAGSTSSATSTAHVQSGASSSWNAGRGSVESGSQKGGVWHAGSALAPIATNESGSGIGKNTLETSQPLRPVASKAAPPAGRHISPAVGKTQISHLSGGHSLSANAHSSIGRRGGGESSGHGTQFRFSRSKSSTAATNASGTDSKSGAGLGMDSLQRSENAVRAAENPSVDDSLKK